MNQKIMVIDDDRGVRLFLQKALAVKGFEITLADRGATGLQMLLADPHDLVFIDVNMPEISGTAICKALRSQPKTQDLPIVMMTAMFKNELQKQEFLQASGANTFLLKPFTVAEVYQLLDQLLGTAIEDKKQQQKSAPETVAPNRVEGGLKRVPLPVLLHKLYKMQQTGLLHLQREEIKKGIYIRRGYPVFARSNVLSECLGQMLVTEGLITRAQCNESLEKCKASGLLQGTVLIEMGLLTPQQLHDSLRNQVTEKLLNCFSWDDGTFSFVPQTDLKKNITSIKLSPAALIHEGIKRYWRHERIVDFLAPFQDMYLKQSDNPQYRFQEISLSTRSEEILTQCLGDISVQDLLQRHPLSKVEVEQTIASLLIAGMITAEDSPCTPDPEAVARRKSSTPIDRELRKQILSDYEKFLNANYFEVLGISPDNEGQDPRRAYYRLAKSYHPDRYLGMGLSDEMEKKVNEIFSHITEAYNTLSDAQKRQEYQLSLKDEQGEKVDVNQVIEAETCYQRAKTLLKTRHYLEAMKKLQKAIEMSPEEPEYLTNYALAIYKSYPENTAQQNKALEILLRSREMNPSLELTHLTLGQIYKTLGKDRQAEKAFELAVQINPQSTEALRELRLFNLRREQDQPGKGLFKKLLSKED